jgi:LysR family glycine cleavage system transcriptional activator
MQKTHNKKRLPSLRAVHAFVVSAELGSFTDAANRLNVTQSAISRLIQELERQLSIKLFSRSGPNLRLTPQGQEFAQTTSRAIELIEQAVETVHSQQEKTYVTLSMLPSVVTNWFAPRLGKFINTYPGIDVRVCASRGLVDFRKEDIDIAIRYGEGKWPGHQSELLATEAIFPVCTPEYAKRMKLSNPDNLKKATLFHAEINENWKLWFRKAGLSDHDIPDGPKLGEEAAIRQAVCDGHGVSLGRSILIADDLKVGRLIAPYPVTLEASYSYWLVTLENKVLSPQIETVINWLKSEFSK